MSPWKKCVSVVIVACGCGLWLPGCAPFDFGAHETLDSWYVGRFDTFDVEEVGFLGIDGTFAGYLVNDIVIRTPVYLGYEAVWIALLPVALPYYGYVFVERGLSGGESEEAPQEEPAPSILEETVTEEGTVTDDSDPSATVEDSPDS